MDATVTVALKQMYPTVETDDEDDEVDETRDFGSNWRGLGIGRLLVLALVLALFISAGLWMLEAQFKKQQEAAHLNPGNAASERTGPDRPASQAQPPPAGSKDSSPTASPSEQTPVPALPANFEPLQQKSASGNNIDEPSAQPPAHAGPLASVKKSVALKCSDILSRLQLGESSRSDLDALRQCKLR